MPDFFEPEGPFDINRYPPKNSEDSAAIQGFFGSIASPPDNVQKLTKFGQHLKATGIKTIGIYGFCWGKCLTGFASIFVLKAL
jgi:dienelactone hydrolase